MAAKPKISLGIGYAELGRALGLPRGVVWQWFQPSRKIPLKHLKDVGRVTGLPRHVLRPDVYEAPQRQAGG